MDICHGPNQRGRRRKESHVYPWICNHIEGVEVYVWAASEPDCATERVRGASEQTNHVLNPSHEGTWEPFRWAITRNTNTIVIVPRNMAAGTAEPATFFKFYCRHNN